MTLYDALQILAMVHTRDAEMTGFVVEMGATPHLSATWQGEWLSTGGKYVEAWRTVRRELHLPCGDELIAAKQDQG